MADTQTNGTTPPAGDGRDRARESAEHLQAAARELIAAARAALAPGARAPRRRPSWRR